MYNEGISRAGDLLDTGVKFEVIKKAGNSYSYGKEKLGVGREKAKAFLKEHPKVMDKIATEIWKVAKKSEE